MVNATPVDSRTGPNGWHGIAASCTEFRFGYELALLADGIPYVIVLSAVGLFTYSVIVPSLTGTLVAPGWAWGCFAAAGGILGAWCAAKTQRFVPEHLLKLMQGGITGIVGALYVAGFFFDLRFGF